MDLTDVLRILFYIWLFAALGVWAYRGYKRFVRGSADDLAERATVGSDAGTKGAAADELTSGKGKGAAPARRSMRQVLDDQKAAKEPDPPTPAGGLVNSVLKEEIAARKAREAGASAPDDTTADPPDDSLSTTERRGLFAPTADDEAATPAVAVSTLLEGIDMPCDLVPLITTEVVPSPHHVVFVTTGHSPAAIGAAIGDELERLGFTLRSETDTEVLAVRDGEKLRVILHPDARTSEKDGTPLFPSVPGGSVAVEFRS